ncbi:LOW QUALITY PROTEIN: GTPase IMAP family member 8-like [Rhynchonycteris naso]
MLCSRAATLLPNPTSRELRFLLLEKCGAGKNARGNTILGKDVFTSKFSEPRVTTMCQIEPGAVKGEKVVVIDTPTFSSTACAKDKQHHIECRLALSDLSLHTLLLVVIIRHYKWEDREAIKEIQKVFGAGAVRHTIIIFTSKDELGDDSVQDYFESDGSVKELVETCRSQYCTFNHKAEGVKRHSQVTELLGQVKCLVDENGGPYRMNIRNEEQVLVLVLQLGRFTQQDEEVVMLESIFGDDVTESMTVLFTRKEDRGRNLIDYCNNTDSRTLRKIIKKCAGRVCAFNNKETGLAIKDQVTDLLEMAHELIGNRNGHGYFCTQETAS